MKFAVIMAAGKGTRMKSELPKVLHKVLDDAMAQVILNNVKKAGAERTVAIVGYGHELVEKALEGQCEFAVQEPQLGTGHAVMQAKQLEGEKGLTLVVNGDCPCVRSETYSELYKAVEDADMAVLTVVPEDAASYGRVIRNADGTVEKIVEFKDATPEEREVREVNTGIYAFNNEALFEGLKLLKNDNAQHEYYITDLVEILQGLGKTVKAVKAEESAQQEELKRARDHGEARDGLFQKLRQTDPKQLKRDSQQRAHDQGVLRHFEKNLPIVDAPPSEAFQHIH